MLQFKYCLMFSAFMAVNSMAEATTIVYGLPTSSMNPTSQMNNGGTGGANQLIANPAMMVSTQTRINITSWAAFNPNYFNIQVAAVIFTPDGTGKYNVTGMDYQTLTPGYNSFFNPVFSGSLAGETTGGSKLLVDGAIFGLYNGLTTVDNILGKVANASYPSINGPGANPYDPWGRDLLYRSGLPPDGTALTFTTFGITETGGTAVNRTYAFQVTAEAPVPATLGLLVSGFLAWRLTARKENLNQ